jgi:hypothetical protein
MWMGYVDPAWLVTVTRDAAQLARFTTTRWPILRGAPLLDWRPTSSALIELPAARLVRRERHSAGTDYAAG